MIKHYLIDVSSLSAEQRALVKEGLEHDSESDLFIDWTQTKDGHLALDVMWESETPIEASEHFPRGCVCTRLE